MKIREISLGDRDYPFALTEISSSPVKLFLKGNADILRAQYIIAVVGTRKISSYGKRVLDEIIPALVRAGAVIVSGLAYGIDGLAHEIALDYGGKAIAVFAGGLDTIYPVEHIPLAKRILDNGGALISEHPVGTPSLRQYFPARNRIISGLSRATLIIEAKKKSGSLITAQFALNQNRDVYAAPGDIFLDNQKGTNLLIAQGAYPITSAEDLLRQLNLENSSSQEAQQTILEFQSDEERLIYDFLREPRSLDDISQGNSLDPSMVSQIISMMELNGMIIALGNMRYVRK